MCNFFKYIIISYVFLLTPLNCLAIAKLEQTNFAKGLVLDVKISTETEKEIDFMMNQESNLTQFEEQKVKVKILNNKNIGKIIHITNDLKHNPFDIKVKKGDKVFLYTENFNNKTEYYIQDFWHLDYLLFWLIFFFLIIILLGQYQGLKTIITLFISLFIIFIIFIPALNKGASPLFTAGLISLGVSSVTLPLIHDFSLKALVSIIGTLGGVFTALFFSFLIGYFSHFNGLGTEDMRILAINNPDFNFQGILFAGIIIGALGAIMDIAVSISSGLQEIRQHQPKISFNELFRSGMNIGKDIMGSMLNTLIFAYVGTSLAMILIISQNKISIIEFLNYGFVTEEIIRAIIGSIGLLATIPITAISAGGIYVFFQKK